MSSDATAREPAAFSVSLAVADLAASRRFYETIGFQVAGGDAEQGWLMLRNGSAVIGLFQGMFDHNILTFNPGWNQAAEAVDVFDDVRDVQQRLVDAGYEPVVSTDADGSGPAHVVVVDPDGNQVMFDQHVDRPG